jgi:hypothetical protein
LLVAIGEKSKASSALQQSDLHKEMWILRRNASLTWIPAWLHK